MSSRFASASNISGLISPSAFARRIVFSDHPMPSSFDPNFVILILALFLAAINRSHLNGSFLDFLFAIFRLLIRTFLTVLGNGILHPHDL